MINQIRKRMFRPDYEFNNYFIEALGKGTKYTIESDTYL